MMKNNRVIEAVVSFVCVLAFYILLAIFFGGFGGLQGQQNAYTDNVLTSRSAVIDYIERVYGHDADIIDLKVVSEKNLYSNNYVQTQMIKEYNQNHASRDRINEDTGVCWGCTAASLIEFYNSHAKPNAVFEDSVNIVRSNKYILFHSLAGGLPSNKTRPLINKLLPNYNISFYTTKEYRSDIFINHKSSIDYERVDWFNIPQHAMVGCGYVVYNFIQKFKDNRTGANIMQKAELNVAIVNSTWDVGTYSFFPCDLIDQM